MLKLSSNRKALIAGAAVLGLLGAGGLYLTLSPSASEAPVLDEGETLAHAAPEGVIELTPAQQRAAGVEVVAVARGGGSEIRLSGRVEPMVDARAAVSAAVGGRVERVLVAPGQSVRAGQALAVMVSGEAASLSAEVDAAQAAAIAAEQAHDRDEDLADLGVVARREAEVSHAQAASAQAVARAARARAAAAGSPSASGRFNVVSPIAGVVSSVQTGPGGFMPQGGVVAEVTNPSRVEVVFNAPAALASSVGVGATLRVNGPQGEFEAVVTGVAAGAGRESGATVIRARTAGGGLPPAGAAVAGVIITGESLGGFFVPSEAVQTVDGGAVVFVQVDGGFRAQPVLTGRQAGGRTEILRGLTGTERVASTNAFLLKAELAKGEAEHGH
ncbi:efflux RND transporter periplasmic adaptor subunit [Brevundimonas pondensis]|uniref:Efflux RND transporter periplasmic adaptor subunit n=1 Tax=Brevundimonas pondensis TaxID=2774189 RepID=A0ABX7SPA0_9CAUL|nr:efflux RND transporter periplasmic adaptor subunit [Brevundimonas pondensis]QTC89174.1 efflux RND transporter periplasmic adaptor subunit [Brevundimonas pondensis]